MTSKEFKTLFADFKRQRFIEDTLYDLDEFLKPLFPEDYGLIDVTPATLEERIKHFQRILDDPNTDRPTREYVYYNLNLLEKESKKRKVRKIYDKDNASNLEIIRAIKQIPIMQILSDYSVKTKKGSSNRFYVNCMFHNEKTPSMVINTDRNTFKCFGCQKYGSVIDMYMQLAGVNLADAIKSLKEKV